jgi:hypothetical protein
MLRQLTGVALALAGALYGQTSTNSFQGVIRDTSGEKIPNAIVSYHRIVSYLPREGRRSSIPVLSPGESWHDGAIAADANGQYQVTGMPSGNYAMCAHHPTLPYLDPCIWGSASKTAVAASTAVSSLVLTKGVFLRVHVSDPGKLLPSSTTILRSDLTVGLVYGTGGFLAASLVKAGTGGRDYQIAVPSGRELKCWIWSGDYILSDEKNIAVAQGGAGFPFQVTTGTDQSFTFTVTGKRSAR